MEPPVYSTHEKAPPLQLLQYSPTTWSGADFNLNQIEVELDDVFAQFEELELKDFRSSPALTCRSSSVESSASNASHYEPCGTKDPPADRSCLHCLCGEKVSSKESSGDHPEIHRTAATQKIHPCSCSISDPPAAEDIVRRDTVEFETETQREHINSTRALLKDESLPPLTITAANQDELPKLNALVIHNAVTTSLSASSLQAGRNASVPGSDSLSVQVSIIQYLSPHSIASLQCIDTYIHVDSQLDSLHFLSAYPMRSPDPCWCQFWAVSASVNPPVSDHE